MSRKRTAIAVVLAVVHPGLGHLYLREWARSLLWAGGFITLTALAVPPPPESMGPIDATMAVARQMSPATALGLSLVVVLNVVDAALIAARGPERRRRDRASHGSSTPTCPNCGKEIDEDIDFCHWCTTRLDDSFEEG